MLDYKAIITKRYVLHMSGHEIADGPGVSKSGVNDFLKALEVCETLSMTNYGIYVHVYGRELDENSSNADGFAQPDYKTADQKLTGRKT